MGRYINDYKGVSLPAKGKADVLIEKGAKEIPLPSEFQPDLVCVVDNGPFEAAAYAHSEGEMNAFIRPDGRRKRWLLVPDVENFAR